MTPTRFETKLFRDAENAPYSKRNASLQIIQVEAFAKQFGEITAKNAYLSFQSHDYRTLCFNDYVDAGWRLRISNCADSQMISDLRKEVIVASAKLDSVFTTLGIGSGDSCFAVTV